MNDEDTLNLNHIIDLTNKLQERLDEAEDARGRLTKALDANGWPDLRSGSSPFNDESDEGRKTRPLRRHPPLRP